MRQALVALLLTLLLANVAWAEKNPIVGMWLLQDSGGKENQRDPMSALVGGFSAKTLIFTDKSMEANGQLQRVEYEISGNEVVVWVEKKGTRFVVNGDTMKMLLPNPLTGKATELSYIRTTKEQAAQSIQKAEQKAKQQASDSAKRARDVRKKEALNHLQGRWTVERIMVNGMPTYFQKEGQPKRFAVIRNNEFLAVGDGKETATMTLSLNPDTSPAMVEATVLEGPIKGKLSLGIYKYEPLFRMEEFTLCLGEPGSKHRPTSFCIVENGEVMMMYLTRSESK